MMYLLLLLWITLGVFVSLAHRALYPQDIFTLVLCILLPGLSMVGASSTILSLQRSQATHTEIFSRENLQGAESLPKTHPFNASGSVNGCSTLNHYSFTTLKR